MDSYAENASGPAVSGLLLPRGEPSWYVSGEDALVLDAFNTATGVTLTLCGRFRNLNGLITPFVFTQTPTTDSVRTRTVFPLGEGWLLNASVFNSAGTPTGTQCVALVRVARGLTSAGTIVGTLAQGPITASQDVTYPPTVASTGMSSLATGATIRSITVTTPAAGAEFSQTVDAAKRWRIQSLRAKLQASAAVATRSPQLFIDDGANVFYVAEWPAQITAGSGQFYIAASGTQKAANVTDHAVYTFPIGLILAPGSRIRSNTLSIQAADQWSLIQLLVEEWGN